MKYRLLPLSLTLLGFLICVSPLFMPMDNFPENLQLAWAIGIPLHFVAAVIFFFQKYETWKKVLYLILPIPLGFILSFAMIMLCNVLFGWWH